MSFPPPANQAIFGATTMRRSPDIDISRDYEGVGVCQDVASLVCVMEAPTVLAFQSTGI